MSGRGKSKKLARSSQRLRLKEDRISQLPDPLICHILTHLSIEDSVKTSVLSTRWRTLWLWLPRLELNSKVFPDLTTFVSLGDRFFDSDRVSCIKKLTLFIYNGNNCLYNASLLKPWIEAAVNRKVQHLDCFADHFSYEMPISLYRCETLVSLKLCGVRLDKAKFVSLPCLKTLELHYVRCPNEATFQRLVSSCPILEKLKIIGCDSHREFQVLQVFSLSMQRLQISQNNPRCQVVIDAPLLRYLKINDSGTESYLVNNLGSNAKLDISLVFHLYKFDEESISSKRNSIRDFLPGISKVGEMVIHLYTFQVFHLHSKLEPLPQFDCMSRLDATLCPSNLEWLPTFLECCPNLKSLVLGLDDFNEKINSEEMNQISFPSVPECLLSSLMSVDIKNNISGYAAEMKLVRYFLENSIILKELTLRLDYDGNVNGIFKKLLKIPRRSITCQVVVR